jgi:hypothetical protein
MVLIKAHLLSLLLRCHLPPLLLVDVFTWRFGAGDHAGRLAVTICVLADGIAMGHEGPTLLVVEATC